MIKYCERCGGAVSFRVPEGDNRERAVCDACGTVRYRNPLIVVGCIAARDCRILLCKRSIEPRYGYWTVPAGSRKPAPPSKSAARLRRSMSSMPGRYIFSSRADS